MSRTALRRRWRQFSRPIRNRCVGWLSPQLIRLVRLTLRRRWLGPIWRHGRRLQFPVPGIYAFWHQRLIGMATISQIQPSWILVSEHGDGEMLALALKRLGYRPRRGSSTRGGTKALLQILRGDDGDMGVAITPDGPRGPAQQLGKGTIFLASRAGLPIYPMTSSFSYSWQLPTWDRLVVPAPFTRALTILGEPIHVPAKLHREGIEEYRQKIEGALRTLTEETDRDFDKLFAAARQRHELEEYAG